MGLGMYLSLPIDHTPRNFRLTAVIIKQINLFKTIMSNLK